MEKEGGKKEVEMSFLTSKKTSDELYASSDGSSLQGDENTTRGNWSNPVEFLLSCISYAVGFGNIWRFPYLCMRNGGGAFLIPYFTFLFLCGIPLFFLELSIGQFSSLSPMRVWKVCPIFQGLGWGMVVVSAVVAVYCNVILAWILYYLAMSFQKELPWARCGHPWNTERCLFGFSRYTEVNSTWGLNATTSEASTFAYAALNSSTNGSVKYNSPADEFWERNVLQRSPGIGGLGGLRLELLATLVAAWVLIFLCLVKGVKSSGKVAYVTATLPYALLFSLLIRGVTLPGAGDGILFYLTPKMGRLLSLETWAEACLQIFFSLGPAWGGLITMSSYNKFQHNCLRDAMILPFVNCGTSFFIGFVIFSIIGFMAHDAGLSVEEVITSGPGLVFVAYPAAISRMPLSQLWAVLFFLMLINVGIGTQFGLSQTVISGIQDLYPGLPKKWKPVLTGAVCILLLLLGLPLITESGVYYFQIVDWYAAAFSVMIIALLECAVLAWVYGWRRLRQDIELMLDRRLSIIWKVLWCFVTPILMMGIIVFSCVRMSEPTYGDYRYPRWAVGMGWVLAMMSIIPIPVVAVKQVLNQEGTLLQRLRKSMQPAEDWGPALAKYRQTPTKV